ncbi:expansin-B15-like [Malania oleifera]|uniref:expansin-B15-like n=1 Tax=Malania oleifera TaxID=397392 RepID=UPI0025ADCAE3|nr:expansin-B15-like [Malania oleifera]
MLSRTRYGSYWLPAKATWFGAPNGAGTDGGACGFGSAVSQPPYSSVVSAAGPSLFKSGTACGACYQVKCTSDPSCSGRPVRVVIIDSCPGGPCASDSAHFDLSGTAFGRLAYPNNAERLRAKGVLDIQYMRVPCNYGGKKIAFRVDVGSNPYYFAVVTEFEGGDGDLISVELKDSSAWSNWRSLRQSWGAVWMLNAAYPLKPPFSLRLRTQYTGKTLVASNVIPWGWSPGNIYQSTVNYT